MGDLLLFKALVLVGQNEEDRQRSIEKKLNVYGERYMKVGIRIILQLPSVGI